MTIFLLIIFIVICYAASVAAAMTRNTLGAIAMFVITGGLYIFVALYATGLNGVTLPPFDLKTLLKWGSVAVLGNAVLLILLAPLCKEEDGPDSRSTEAGAFIALLIWGILFVSAGAIPHGTPMPF